MYRNKNTTLYNRNSIPMFGYEDGGTVVEPEDKEDVVEPEEKEVKKEEKKEDKKEDKKEEKSDSITGFTSLTQKVYNRIKDGEVRNITICREPVNKAIQKFINTLSLGLISKIQKKKGYDNLYHLYMIVNVDGSNYKVEKNANIVIKPSNQFSKDRTNINVDKDITFGEMMEKTKKKMGSKFFPYSALTNNCQDFILSILTANGLGQEKHKAFVKQDISDIVKEDKTYLKNITDKITSIGGSIDAFLQKFGIRLSGFKKGGKIEKIFV